MIALNAVRALSVSLICGLNFASSAFAIAPKEIFAPVEKLMIASGFDDNDNVEISIYGNFPDTCYRVGPTGYTVDHANRTIQIWSKAYDYSQREMFCREVLVPFLLKVSVGVLQEGEYSVEMPSLNLKETLHIAKSTTDAPDDFLYAPVTQTSVSAPQNGMQEVTIGGRFPKFLQGCMVLKEVRHYITSGNIVVVQPIAEMVDKSEVCKSVKENFEYKFKINAFSDVGLLHVRSMVGSPGTELEFAL